MPIREYNCVICSKVVERIEIGDSEPPKCPCNDLPMERLVSAGAFHLKGTGFHANDYKK